MGIIGHSARFTLVIVAMHLGGCTQRATPNAPTSAPSTTTASAGEQAIESYVAMWSDFADAATTSNWQSPRLTDHATGPALSVITDALRRDKEKGVVTKGRPTHNPRVSSQDPTGDRDMIRVEDCGDSSDWLKYRADTGALADDRPGGRRAITAELVRAEGAWKVREFTVRAVGTC
ncbi:putative secreted protein/lipoprotein [Alloactinosynnema sp. L-07]|uniref:hypothetical protein n=1 Tax=Alloactinosynnema sp. L-07 TaxID=1653480 RepID=UPI00065EF38B|nr:hypothetical protein [Alloactinosynnema sp. L-07]CRK57650.1 putative secreted protein/lipoprotein [Alloactinosynnema sp. L-07]